MLAEFPRDLCSGIFHQETLEDCFSAITPLWFIFLWEVISGRPNCREIPGGGVFVMGGMGTFPAADNAAAVILGDRPIPNPGISSFNRG